MSDTNSRFQNSDFGNTMSIPSLFRPLFFSSPPASAHWVCSADAGADWNFKLVTVLAQIQTLRFKLSPWAPWFCFGAPQVSFSAAHDHALLPIFLCALCSPVIIAPIFIEPLFSPGIVAPVGICPLISPLVTGSGIASVTGRYLEQPWAGKRWRTGTLNQ
jgi:hypothetical protein